MKLNILCRDASVTTSIWMEASVVIAVVLLGFGFFVLNLLSILSDFLSPDTLTQNKIQGVPHFSNVFQA